MSILFLFLQNFHAKSLHSDVRMGNDISYPYCRKPSPFMVGFGIVGINGGISVTTNPCLSEELYYAGQSMNSTQQTKTELYVNTGNPGGDSPFWAITNSDPSGYISPNPYGTCDGSNSLACSWQYGWNRSIDDIDRKFIPGASAAGADIVPSDYFWWLDVETKNTWESGTSNALTKNRAVIEGMVSAFHAQKIEVGVYSSQYQWNIIVGTITPDSNLNGLPNWRPGALNFQEAESYCSLPPLTSGGTVTMTQYTTNVDIDYQC